jgi:hypothetical protein
MLRSKLRFRKSVSSWSSWPAGHDPVVALGLRGLDEVVEGVDAAVLVHPQQEGVLGHAGDGLEGQGVDAEVGLAHRRGVEAVERHHDRVIGVQTTRVLEVDERLGPGPAGLVDRHEGLGGELVLLDDALHQARHLVGATALAGHDDEVDGLLGLPRLCVLGRGEGARGQGERAHHRGDRGTSHCAHVLILFFGLAAR